MVSAMSCFLTSQQIEFSEPRTEVFGIAIKLVSVPSPRDASLSWFGLKAYSIALEFGAPNC